MKSLDKTLTQLENQDWGPAPSDAPPHLRECFELRNRPLRTLDAEGLRVLIGQDIGLSHLMPIAISLLKMDPLVAGMHYPGDLLVAVLRVSSSYFNSHPEVRRSVSVILENGRSQLSSLDPIERECASEAIEEAAASFECK